MTDTADKILTIATTLIQQRGFNGFSYQDIANELGIKKASIHYHFPNKANLVQTILSHYRQSHQQILDKIESSSGSYNDKLQRFAGLFQQTLGPDYLMCPSGMLAAESHTLPPDVLSEVQLFFLDNERWLSTLLKAGSKNEEFELPGSPEEIARMIFAALEGALLSARTFNEVSRLNNITQILFKAIHSEKSIDYVE